MTVTVTSWTKQGGSWVAWDKQTRIMQGWVEYKDKLYYIKDGFMLEGGFHDIDGQRYYFGKDGDCKYRWQEIGGHWYYFYHDDGHMVKNSLLIGRGGQVYFLDKEGRMLANCTAEFNKSGELCINGKPVDGSFIYDDGLSDN